MERLYEQKPDIKEFDAQVISCEGTENGTYNVILDRTAFYPEGGGQPFDMGTLGEARVISVHEKDKYVIHETDKPFQAGENVHGIIDWDRRFIHMQHHTGEHLFSGLVRQHYGYHNVGFHMGQEMVTIDFDGILTMEQVLELEKEANELVYCNIPVETWYPPTEELHRLDYRSKKELSGPVRLVRIAGGDLCACCGTHVSYTGEIGTIKITGLKKYKGGVRLEMLCGRKALMDYEGKQEQVMKISGLLSAKQPEVAEAVEKVMKESLEKDGEIARLYQQIFDLKCTLLPDNEDSLLVFEKDLPSVQLRKFADMLCRQQKANLVLACSGEDGTYQYVLCSTSEDAGRFAKQLNERLKGKGNGKKTMAQGILLASRKEIEDLWKQEFWKKS